MHAIGDVGRDVDQTNELDFLAARLDNLGNFVGNNTTIRVTCKGVGAVGLSLLHGIGVATDHLSHGGEDGLALIETAGTEGIEGALSIEVLGQVHEDQDFADTRVNEEDGGLVASSLERNDGVVNVSIRGRGVEDFVDQSGEQVRGRVQQDAEDGNFVRELHGHLDLTLKPMQNDQKGFLTLIIASLPDNVNARATHFEEVVLGRYASSFQTEDALEDGANLLRDGTWSSLDELLVTTQLQESIDAVEVLVEHTLRVLLDQLGAAELAQSGFLLGELFHGNGDDLMGSKGHHPDANVLDVSVSLLEESGNLKVGFLGGIFRVEIEAGCVEDDERLSVLVGSTEGGNDQVRVGDQALGLLALKVGLKFRNTVGNAMNDDGILYPSTQPQLSILDNAEITSPEPVTLNEALLGGGGIVVVLDEQHWTTELKFTRLPVTKGGGTILRRDNAHLHTRVSATKGQKLQGGEFLSRVGEGTRNTVIDGASTVKRLEQGRVNKTRTTNQVSVIPKPAAISMVRSSLPGARTRLRASKKAFTVEVTTASPPLLILLRVLRLKEPWS